MMKVNAPLLCVEGWKLDPSILLGKPVVNRGEDLRHYVLYKGISTKALDRRGHVLLPLRWQGSATAPCVM